MEPEAKYTVVGGAVLVLVALIAATVVWLRSSGEGADAQRYKIYFEQHSLEGLERRNSVTMRGVQVGSVTDFRFSTTRPGAIEVFIMVHPTTPVRESTRATVDRHLVTGLASVRLVNITEKSPLLAEAPPQETYPVIPEGESSMQQVSETLTQLAQRANTSMQRINELLSPENQAAFTDILRNLRRLSEQADGTLARIDASLDSMGSAAEEVRGLAKTVAGDARTLAARYDSLGEEATVSVQEVRTAVRKMSADVERLAGRADALLASSDDELRVTAQALRSAADSVGAAASRLGDPRQLIFGPAESSLGPGESSR